MSHVKGFSHLLSKGDPLIFGPLVSDLKKHLKNNNICTCSWCYKHDKHKTKS